MCDTSMFNYCHELWSFMIDLLIFGRCMGRARGAPRGRLAFPWASQMISDGFRWLQSVADGAGLFQIMVICIRTQSWSIEFKDHAMNSVIILWIWSSFNAFNDNSKVLSSWRGVGHWWVDYEVSECWTTMYLLFGVSCWDNAYIYIFPKQALGCRGPHGMKGWWRWDAWWCRFFQATCGSCWGDIVIG